jgi:BirA family transcriptional regulator, biotin operon repressor / biotin---[acetyl-CoA-carboxylase] ligase
VKSISFGENTIFLPKTDSTNIEAWRHIKERDVVEGTMVWTNMQLEGKGAGSNKWISEADKNITVSFIIYPEFLKIEEQFYLNKIVSLAIRDSVYKILKKKHEVFVKWPNDIIVNHSKVAGILIETSIIGNKFGASVIGIGLNVNQAYFPSVIVNATSLKIITEKNHILYKCADELCTQLTKWYKELQNANYNKINQAYLANLYMYKQKADYCAGGKIFDGEIIGISDYGKLQLKISDGKVEEYAFKEVELII